MTVKSKTIRDPIHGDIKFEGVFLDLIEAPEIQRLYNIKQLGFAHLVFPGAHHTRLEHSLGTYHMASRSAEILDLEKDDIENCNQCCFTTRYRSWTFFSYIRSYFKRFT
jgi:HD superfamily phosphohydrolase